MSRLVLKKLFVKIFSAVQLPLHISKSSFIKLLIFQSYFSGPSKFIFEISVV